MARKLKIFRTSIGFHDAYVAAPSRKAALAAWGSGHDLFASGAAEEVTDPALTRAPLDKPGTVIKVTRGSAGEHLAALGKTRAKARAPTSKTSTASPRPASPRPSRAVLDRAEAAVAEAEKARETELASIAKEMEKLARAKRDAEEKHRRAIARLERAAEEKRADYEDRLARWREAQ